jgi:hypothetical protein
MHIDLHEDLLRQFVFLNKKTYIRRVDPAQGGRWGQSISVPKTMAKTAEKLLTQREPLPVAPLSQFGGKKGIQCSFFLWNTHSGLFPNGKPCGKRHSYVGDHFPPAPILPHLSKTNLTGIEKYFF